MDVPDWKFQFTDRGSFGNKVVGGVLQGHAANMLIPGAVMSGCAHQKKNRLSNQSDLANSTNN